MYRQLLENKKKLKKGQKIVFKHDHRGKEVSNYDVSVFLKLIYDGHFLCMCVRRVVGIFEEKKFSI